MLVHAHTYVLLHMWILLILKNNFYYILPKFMDKNNEIESKHLSFNLYPAQMCVCIILICVYVITCAPLFVPRVTSFHVSTCTGDMCCLSTIIVPCNVKLNFVCVLCAQWGLEDNFWNRFIPSFMWVLGMDLRASSLVPGTLPTELSHLSCLCYGPCNELSQLSHCLCGLSIIIPRLCVE